eukprot:26445-Pelagomonas_calceolata.AAC.4
MERLAAGVYLGFTELRRLRDDFQCKEICTAPAPMLALLLTSTCAASINLCTAPAPLPVQLRDLWEGDMVEEELYLDTRVPKVQVSAAAKWKAWMGFEVQVEQHHLSACTACVISKCVLDFKHVWHRQVCLQVSTYRVTSLQWAWLRLLECQSCFILAGPLLRAQMCVLREEPSNLWLVGNQLIASAREVLHNHE